MNASALKEIFRNLLSDWLLSRTCWIFFLSNLLRILFTSSFKSCLVSAVVMIIFLGELLGYQYLSYNALKLYLLFLSNYQATIPYTVG